MGLNSQATGTNAIAIGQGAVATGSIAAGTGAFASNGGAAFGDFFDRERHGQHGCRPECNRDA